MKVGTHVVQEERTDFRASVNLIVDRVGRSIALLFNNVRYKVSDDVAAGIVSDFTSTFDYHRLVALVKSNKDVAHNLKYVYSQLGDILLDADVLDD